MTHEMISNRNMAVLVDFAPAARHHVCRPQRDRRHPQGWVCRPLTNHYHYPFQHAITLRTPVVSLSLYLECCIVGGSERSSAMTPHVPIFKLFEGVILEPCSR
jgi:hypothetical protein